MRRKLPKALLLYCDIHDGIDLHVRPGVAFLIVVPRRLVRVAAQSSGEGYIIVIILRCSQVRISKDIRSRKWNDVLTTVI